ncbi:MAG: hypothetical protein B6U88_00170 [Candidatus Aenigmarchaeota archaeon ex4484_56]|nr:MAG: hypothetical protein B6U88_00170 [Candidatus Aenigmarchaeota archaeon ex4484_56]
MGRIFYDLHINPEEEVNRFIRRAEELGLGGICMVEDNFENIDNYLEKLKKLKENTKIDLITGFLINNENIEKIAKKIRRKFDLIFVSGGDYTVNRNACSSGYVDILCHPEKNRKDCGVDHICCKDAKENNVVIEVNFGELLRLEGLQKIKELNKLKEIVRICVKTKTNFIVNSGAKYIYEMRGGRELSSLSYSLGASLYEAIVANSELPMKIVSINREKKNNILNGMKYDG